MLDSDTRRRIDSARDILVGKVPDPKTQVEQITFAMIYKFMDDMDQQSVGLGGAPAFFANGYEQYAWSKLMDKRLSGEGRLDLYVRALDQMSQNPHIPALFRDIFKGAFLPYRDSETLNLFLKEMDSFRYDHSEDLGDAYEYLLSIFASQGKAGQFRTPRHIIDFIVQCVDPDKTDTVLDPACGTAGFLISAFKHIEGKYKDSPLSPDEKKRLTQNFVGYDISPDMVRLSRVNMYLHQFPNPTIHEYDTLTSEDRWDETYDVILANPPFMTPKGGIRPHKRFAVRANRSEVLFVDYIAEHLNAGGRAGVIVPEGIIFQSSNAYKDLRRYLVEEKYLYAVVSLPAGVFNPYSGVKTSILLMDRSLSRQADSILFIKIEADGFDLGAQRRQIERNDVPEALRVIKAFQADPNAPLPNEGLAQVVKKSRLAKSLDYNLSAERYMENGVVNRKWPMVRLGDVAEYINGFPFKPEDWNDSGTEIIRIQNLTGSSNKINWTQKRDVPEKYSVYPGDLLISWSATIGFYIWTREKAYLNQHIFKVIPNEKILKTYLYFLGNRITKLIEEKVHGNTMQHITRGLFDEIAIPLPPIDIQREIVAEIEGYHKVIDGARQVIENYKPTIPIDPSWPLVKLAEIFTNSNETILPICLTGSINYIGLENIESETGRIIGEIVSEKSKIKSSKKIYKAGDILFGKLRPYLNKVYLADHEGVCSTDILVLKKKSINVNPEFYVNYFKSSSFITEVSLGISGSQLPRVGWSYFSSIHIPYPELSVQEKIVKELRDEQNVIAMNQAFIESFNGKIAARIQQVWGEM